MPNTSNEIKINFLGALSKSDARWDGKQTFFIWPYAATSVSLFVTTVLPQIYYDSTNNNFRDLLY